LLDSNDQTTAFAVSHMAINIKVEAIFCKHCKKDISGV